MKVKRFLPSLSTDELGPESSKNRDTRSLQELLTPYPSEEKRAYPVNTRVNEGPDLIAPSTV